MQIQKHVLKQEQKLKMTPQLYQAIKIMALPIQDLRLCIREEIEKNPALEIIEDKALESFDEVSSRSSDDYDFFDETSDSGYISNQRNSSEDLKRKFIEGVLTRPESLHDHLLWQLKLQPISDKWYNVGEMLILNLDENGFHIEPPELLVKEDDLDILYHMMKMIQGFDPVGVCTKDYKEALLVQIENHPEPHPLSYQVVDQYLEHLEKGKYKEIVKGLRISDEKMKSVLQFIRTLEPLPGRNFATETAKYVIPDVRVIIKEGEFHIILNDEDIPVLGINPFFNKIKSSTKHGEEKDAKLFVTSSINDAKWFIKSINQRNNTLLKVCKAVVEFQREFFRRGSKYLVPLTLKDISQEIGVHEATVSRITNGKYVQTEFGIFELKYFFTNSISGSGSTGSRFSKEGVKQIIKEIIQNEGGEANLSDNRIVDILANRGIKIARRTISKYRKELGIMSSFQRKKLEEEI
ncbi:MAG: RNA polymerase factor sigma-54 [Spirochaetales bacterium]|nr:RNA polymerase factor sigma-54 [Spirochaetales bacterium]